MTRRRSHAPSAGYTMVEVMTSIAILTVGAAGVIAMQKTTLLANNNGRMLATANVIAASWADRLSLDAVQWNNFNNVPDITDTTWVKTATVNPGQWFIPVQSADASPIADPIGVDVHGNDASAHAFCTHLRMYNMFPNLVRTEIRVFWDRSGQAVDCTQVPAVWDAGKYGAVYVTTSVIQNVTQQ